MLKNFTPFCICLILLLPAIGQAQQDLPIQVRSFDISVKAGAFDARTILEIELFNPNSRVLDGSFEFPLAEGQVISGFALDIAGKMRDGVVVEKQKGRLAYENTIRRRIDPGLLEQTSENNYRLRVYPVPGHGIRKVRIVVDQLLLPIANNLKYFFPLSFTHQVDRFHVGVKVNGHLLMPQAEEGLLSGEKFSTSPNGFLLDLKHINYLPDKALAFVIPLSGEKQICADDHGYFAARLPIRLTQHPIVTGGNFTIFWDVSASAARSNKEKQQAYLKEWMQMVQPRSIRLVCFSNDLKGQMLFDEPLKNFKAISRFLNGQVYDGGTQLGVIDCRQYTADAFLLFSDGISNFGKENIILSEKPVICINAATGANAGLLKNIARKTAGRYIDLSVNTVEEALVQTEQTETVVNINHSSNNIAELISWPGNGWILLFGKTGGREGKIDMQLKGNSGITQETVVIPAARSADCGELHETWNMAALKISEPGISSLQVAKEFSVVSATTSLIVLDNFQDYFEYGIDPPADLLDSFNRQFMVKKKERDENRKRNLFLAELQYLRLSALSYNQQIAWYDPSLPQIDLARLENPAVPLYARGGSGELVMNNFPGMKMDQHMDEVVVTAYGMQARRALSGSVATISMERMTGSFSVDQALQGRVAGVSVYHDGSPGTATEVRIRGAAAIDAGAAPLYVLDGMPVNSSDVANLNTSDIGSITVLKDNAAASIYGYRAAHGAIIITSRRITPQKPEGVPRYDELEDIDYIQELSAIGAERKYAAYLELRTGERANDAAFYFDVAEHFFQSGLKEEALTVLSNLAEINKEDHQLLRAMGYMLETWKDYEEAIDVFRKILKLKEEEPQSYRDLALALARAGQYQQASEILLEVLKKDWQWYEQRYNGLRGIMLNELNGIIALHADDMNMTAFPSEIIRPLPADLRIVIDWNKDETDIDLHVVEPDGEECFYQHTLTKNRGRISHDFTNGYGPEEYEVRNALKGKYRIRVNYYGDRYQKTSVPSYIRLTIYRNFGKPDQQMEMKTFIMDGQSGMLEIATEKI